MLDPIDGLFDLSRQQPPAMPRSRLVSLVRLVETLAEASGGRALVPELADALTSVRGGDDWMLYAAAGPGLADGIDDFAYEEFGGYNARGDVLCELMNCRFWENPEATIREVAATKIMMLRDDATNLAERLWTMFFPGEERSIEDFRLMVSSAAGEPGKTLGPSIPDPAWPWGDYETKLLRDLAAAAHRWWVNFDPTDPTTAPTNDQVSAWLVKERKATERIADAMATILRADGLRPGPRK